MYNQLKGEKHMLEHPTTGHILTSQGEDFSRQAVREFVRRERDTGDSLRIVRLGFLERPLPFTGSGRRIGCRGERCRPWPNLRRGRERSGVPGAADGEDLHVWFCPGMLTGAVRASVCGLYGKVRNPAAGTMVSARRDADGRTERARGSAGCGSLCAWFASACRRAPLWAVWVADFCGRLGIRRKNCGFDSTRVRAYRVGRETVHDYVGMRAGKTRILFRDRYLCTGVGRILPGTRTDMENDGRNPVISLRGGVIRTRAGASASRSTSR